MPKRLDFKNLRICLENYTAERLHIRDCGGVREDGKYSCQGRAKVNESLEGRTLDFRKDKSGLYFLIDSTEVFHFPMKGYNQKDTKGFTLAYERVELVNGVEKMVMLGTGIDPYDPALPEPRRSFLRHIIDDHLLEIYFHGRIHLKFHSWWQKPYWKYWTAVKPPF